MGECTREGVGAAPGTCLPWLGGRDGCSWGVYEGGSGGGTRYSSLLVRRERGGARRGVYEAGRGAPGTRL